MSSNNSLYNPTNTPNSSNNPNRPNNPNKSPNNPNNPKDNPNRLIALFACWYTGCLQAHNLRNVNRNLLFLATPSNLLNGGQIQYSFLERDYIYLPNWPSNSEVSEWKPWKCRTLTGSPSTSSCRQHRGQSSRD